MFSADLFGKKKDKLRPRFSPDTAGLRGALSWRVVVEDCGGDAASGTNKELESFLAVSPDSLAVVQDSCHHDILFLVSTRTVIGWTCSQNSARIYFHQGEALILHSKDWESDDMSEICQRLKAVSQGAATQEFTLRRNQLGQLGFHVQHDGLITEVENFGYAWQTGLRQGSRLVEVNRHPVASMDHEKVVELLKTSMTVTVTVIPPHPDGSPRTGCSARQCQFAFGARTSSSDVEGDYENLHTASASANAATGVAVINAEEARGQQPSKGGRTVLDSSGR